MKTLEFWQVDAENEELLGWWMLDDAACQEPDFKGLDFQNASSTTTNRLSSSLAHHPSQPHA